MGGKTRAEWHSWQRPETAGVTSTDRPRYTQSSCPLAYKRAWPHLLHSLLVVIIAQLVVCQQHHRDLGWGQGWCRKYHAGMQRLPCRSVLTWACPPVPGSKTDTHGVRSHTHTNACAQSCTHTLHVCTRTRTRNTHTHTLDMQTYTQAPGATHQDIARVFNLFRCHVWHKQGARSCRHQRSHGSLEQRLLGMLANNLHCGGDAHEEAGRVHRAGSGGG